MTKVTEDTSKKVEVAFPSSDPSCQLHGDLTLPTSLDGNDDAPLPAIVIVAGSGPLDRDGNAPALRLNINTSNRFAERMLERPPGRGVAVLSYDKRGVGKSQPTPRDKNFYYSAGMMDLVGDAVEAVRFAASHPRIDETRIVLLGHSEGAIIIPLICRGVTEDDALAPIAGCIFYAGFGENLVDAMTLQRETIANEVNEMTGPKGWILRRFLTKEYLEKKYNELMEKINAPDEPDFVSMQCGLNKQPAKWLREHVAYDADAALAKHVTCHCLAITGRKDFQVRNEFCAPERAATLVPNAKSMEAHQPANLTHVLRSMEGPAKMMDLKTDYTRMGKLPLDEGVMAITDAWCDRVLFGNQQ